MSMAKTVVAMLVGIALAERRSTRSTIRREIPAGARRPSVRRDTAARPAHHVLGRAVQRGLQRQGRRRASPRKTIGKQGPGGVDTVFHHPQARHPARDALSRYLSTDTQVLALALRAAVGMPLAEYLSQKIWQPMGAEADATWVIDGGGYEAGSTWRQRHAARLGAPRHAARERGHADGRQILPAGWVKAMTLPSAAPRGRRRHEHNGYGYQTWVIGPGKRYFAMLGVRGQAVFVDPEPGPWWCTPRSMPRRATLTRARQVLTLLRACSTR